MDAERGSVRLKLLTYVPYLNQRTLDKTFTDSFGTTSDVDLRQDFQLNKVSVNFLGVASDTDKTLFPHRNRASRNAHGPLLLS